MSSDISRQRFDPANDFTTVLMQQGRVLLDADWNEWMEIFDRRLRAETVDIIGEAVVPKETINAFKLTVTGGKVAIGPGRMYVHGLMADNHGRRLAFDPVLAEVHGTAFLPFAEQRPYSAAHPDDTPPPQFKQRTLAYLDVWERELTVLEDPQLVENAVGVDSTSRMQTVWRVRFAGEEIARNYTCETRDKDFPAWAKLIRPSDGRLTSGTVPVPANLDPCLIPPSGEYRALENRLYRVEIHDAGRIGTATFKWARHNATIASNILKISGSDLVVGSIGRDSELCFSEGNWVEITDDIREFDGRPGVIRRIASIAADTQTLTLDQPLPPDFPVGANQSTQPERHTRIRRWDHQGKVKDSNGNVIVDLDAGITGVIPVPATGTAVVLEDGIEIKLSLAATDGRFKVGDYWVFAARTEDASVEILTAAPPRGIHHHYARLGFINPNGKVEDCRKFWPPDFGTTTEEECCECSVCVTADSHNNGTLTIQMGVDEVSDVGGTVCLGPGIYQLSDTPVLIDGASSVTIRGQGWRTILANNTALPSLVVTNSAGIILEKFSVLSLGPARTLADVVIINSVSVLARQCVFIESAGTDDNAVRPAIAMGGFVAHVRVQQNMFFGRGGVANLHLAAADASLLDRIPALRSAAFCLSLGLMIDDNFFLCLQFGVSLRGACYLLEKTRITGNDFHLASVAAVIVTGAAIAEMMPGTNVDILSNTIDSRGHGIVAGLGNLRINGNDLGGSGESAVPGITIAAGVVRRVDHLQVIGNRITGFKGDGITMITDIASGLIKQNVIDGVGGGGITMGDNATATDLSIENNQLLNLGLAGGTTTAAGKFDYGTAQGSAGAVRATVAGIRLVQVTNAEVAHNTLSHLGVEFAAQARLSAIQVAGARRVRIAANRIVNLGPPAGEIGAEAISVVGPFGQLDVIDNSIRRADDLSDAEKDTASWWALLIAEGAAGQSAGGMLHYAVGGSQVILMGERAYLTDFVGGEASVRGNGIEYYSRREAVRIEMAGRCAFSDNRATSQRETAEPVVRVKSGTLIMNANYLIGPVGKATRESNFSGVGAAELVVPPPAVAITTNITTAPIVLNGAALPTPWQILNVVLP